MSISAEFTEHTILRVLVGSHAHGLADSESDRDVRSVYVIPTVELFRLGFKYQGTRMTKEQADETAWEVGHFLQLAVQCHPLALESFVAPVETMDEWGARLRALFPSVWSPAPAAQAFLQYADNQRKKMLEKKDGRPAKYAAAYLRVLSHLCDLLEHRTFSLHIADQPLGETLRRIRGGAYRPGEVIDLGEQLTQDAARLVEACGHQGDRAAVDAFLIEVRTAFLP